MVTLVKGIRRNKTLYIAAIKTEEYNHNTLSNMKGIGNSHIQTS